MPVVYLISAVVGDQLALDCADLAITDPDLPLTDADHQWMTAQGYDVDRPEECMYVALEPHPVLPSRPVQVDEAAMTRVTGVITAARSGPYPPAP